MHDTTAFTPLHRQALLAGLRADKHQFHRTRGGYLPVTGERTIFTTRTIRAMERDGLLEFRDPFAEFANLTPEGMHAAKQLRDGEQAKAGVA